MKNEIMNLFAYDSRLTFSQIREKLKARSNLLAYWLNQLVKSNLLTKSNNFYSLADSSEHLVPYLSANKSTMPVIMVHIGDKKVAFLYERKKIPYKNLLSLPGGRLLIGESIENASKRIMKSKFGIEIAKVKIKSISLEHIKKKGNILYSFLLILVSAKSKNDIKMTNIRKMKSKIIKSDYEILNSTRNNQEMKIKTLISRYA